MAERWEDWFEPGETLLWEGAPAKGIHHPVRNTFMTAFGIPFLFGGLATFGAGVAMGVSFASVWSILGAIGLIAFSVPFLGVGSGMIAGPWLHDMLKHDRVRYALSDRAGYIASRWWKRQMNVLPLTPATRVDYDEDRNGIGSVWFRIESNIDDYGDRVTKKTGVETRAEPSDVYALVRDAAATLEKGAT